MTITAPEPRYPMVTLVISNPILPRETKSQPQQAACPHCKGPITMPAVEKAEKEDTKPVLWMVGKPHPIVPSLLVVRMFENDVGVRVFSLSEDHATCVIDDMPFTQLRLTESGMPYETFVAEIEDAEYGDDDDDDLEPEPPAPVAQVAPANSVS